MAPSSPFIRSRTLRGLGLGVALALAAAVAPTSAAAALRAERIATGLDFPVFLTAPSGDTRLFVLERAGSVRIWRQGVILPAPFLDISASISTERTGGLLGLAFPADYAASGLFYLYYTRIDGQIVLSRWRVSANPDLADAGSEEVLLTIANPTFRHNGASIAFSPVDGLLYLAPGDGGGLWDPDEVAQDPQELRGKVLRVDVGGGAGSPLTIPPSNPFVGNPAVRDEIWAFGLRNPYRWSFDRATGDFWLGDVGEQAREEVHFEPAGSPGGLNYGWDIMEGTLCNPNDPSTAFPCNDPALTLPVHDYAHGPHCSITGGYVYRGGLPEPQGLYFFGDFCSAAVWSLDPATLAVTDRSAELAAGLPAGVAIDAVVGFGEDALGSLHILDSDGEIFRVRSDAPACDDGIDNDGDGRVDWDGAGVGPADPGCAGNPLRDNEARRHCGLGLELALLLPPLLRMRRRKRA